MNVSKEVSEYVGSLVPQHKCKNYVFESILDHGYIMSSDFIKNLLNDPLKLVNEIFNHSQIKDMLKKMEIPSNLEKQLNVIKTIILSVLMLLYISK